MGLLCVQNKTCLVQVFSYCLQLSSQEAELGRTFLLGACSQEKGVEGGGTAQGKKAKEECGLGW